MYPFFIMNISDIVQYIYLQDICDAEKVEMICAIAVTRN